MRRALWRWKAAVTGSASFRRAMLAPSFARVSRMNAPASGEAASFAPSAIIESSTTLWLTRSPTRCGIAVPRVLVGNGPTGNNIPAYPQTNRALYDVLGRVFRMGFRLAI